MILISKKVMRRLKHYALVVLHAVRVFRQYLSLSFLVPDCIKKPLQDRIVIKRLDATYREILARNKELKDTYHGKRCFVIGNGPSLNTVDMRKLKNECVIVVNLFHRYKDFKEINSRYYILIDPDWFLPKTAFSTLLKEIETITDPDTIFIVPLSARAYLRESGFFGDRKVYYFSAFGEFKEDLKFNIELDRTIPQPVNSINCSLLVAKYLGCKDIYLLGCDRDSLSRHNPLSDVQQLHFYKDEDDGTIQRAPFELSLFYTALSLKIDRLLGQKFALDGVKIWNANPKSWIDVFEKIEYELIPGL